MTEDYLNAGLESKQDVMLNAKQGFYSPQVGNDGDIGSCVVNGKYYFAIKMNNEWYYAELKKVKDL